MLTQQEKNPIRAFIPIYSTQSELNFYICVDSMNLKSSQSINITKLEFTIEKLVVDY